MSISAYIWLYVIAILVVGHLASDGYIKMKMASTTPRKEARNLVFPLHQSFENEQEVRAYAYYSSLAALVILIVIGFLVLFFVPYQ